MYEMIVLVLLKQTTPLVHPIRPHFLQNSTQKYLSRKQRVPTVTVNAWSQVAFCTQLVTSSKHLCIFGLYGAK